ncbi:hypothetical protein L9F63_024721, partial [Diploptera punctata]
HAMTAPTASEDITEQLSPLQLGRKHDAPADMTEGDWIAHKQRALDTGLQI